MNGMNLFSNRKESNPWTRFWIGLGLAVSHWSLAAYLPVVGPRVLRFDLKTSVPTSSVVLPPLNGDADKAEAMVVATNQPPEHPNGSEMIATNSITESTPVAETEVDPAPVVVNVTPAEPYGPPVANAIMEVGPQTFLRFFQVRGTNGMRILTAPNLFNPPVAPVAPAPSSTATYEVR